MLKWFLIDGYTGIMGGSKNNTLKELVIGSDLPLVIDYKFESFSIISLG